MVKPEVVEMEGLTRDAGKKSSRNLRDEKRVPAILYGPKLEENVALSIDEIELEKILAKSQTQIIELTVDGTTHRTLLKKVDFHPVSDRPIHADFYALADNVKVSLRVPIRLEGTAVGVRDGGGRVFQPMHIIRIKVLPENIPAEYSIDISPLQIGDSLHVSDLEMEGIEPIDDLSRTIVTIRPPKSEALLSALEPDVAEDEEAEVEGEVDAEAEAGEEEAAEGEESEQE